MKKSTIALAVAGVLLLFALLFPYTTSYGFVTNKGLPFSYYKTIDTHGLCIAVAGETTSGGGCGKRSFALNYYHLSEDLIVCAIIAIALVYLTDRKNT